MTDTSESTPPPPAAARGWHHIGLLRRMFPEAAARRLSVGLGASLERDLEFVQSVDDEMLTFVRGGSELVQVCNDEDRWDGSGAVLRILYTGFLGAHANKEALLAACSTGKYLAVMVMLTTSQTITANFDDDEPLICALTATDKSEICFQTVAVLLSIPGVNPAARDGLPLKLAAKNFYQKGQTDTKFCRLVWQACQKHKLQQALSQQIHSDTDSMIDALLALQVGVVLPEKGDEQTQQSLAQKREEDTRALIEACSQDDRQGNKKATKLLADDVLGATASNEAFIAACATGKTMVALFMLCTNVHIDPACDDNEPLCRAAENLERKGGTSNFSVIAALLLQPSVDVRARDAYVMKIAMAYALRNPVEGREVLCLVYFSTKEQQAFFKGRTNYDRYQAAVKHRGPVQPERPFGYSALKPINVSNATRLKLIAFWEELVKAENEDPFGGHQVQIEALEDGVRNQIVVSIHYDRRSLLAACRLGLADLVEDIMRDQQLGPADFIHALDAASELGQVEVVKKLLADERIDIRREVGSALRTALQFKQIECFAMMWLAVYEQTRESKR